MSSSLDDTTLVQDDDLISVFDCTQAMGHNNDGLFAFSNEFVKSSLDLVLTLCIESTGGLVQEKYFRFAHQSTGNGNTLFLPSRQHHATGTDECFETIWEKFSVQNEF